MANDISLVQYLTALQIEGLVQETPKVQVLQVIWTLKG